MENPRSRGARRLGHEKNRRIMPGLHFARAVLEVKPFMKQPTKTELYLYAPALNGRYKSKDL